MKMTTPIKSQYEMVGSQAQGVGPLAQDPLAGVDIEAREYKTHEVGQTGTLNYGGFMDTGEWIGDLKGYPLYQTIDYMRTDAVISSIEKGFFLPIEKAAVSFSYDNAELVNDPKFQEILEFVKKDFARLNMPEFLHNALLFIPYGFSMFEICYAQDKDGFLHLERLAPRLPKTAWRWIIDGNGYLRVMEQLVYTPAADGGTGAWNYIPIPADKLLIITGQKEGGQFVGRSEYRPFYREWKVKDKAFKQLAITIQRVGGGIPYALVKDDATQETSVTIGGTNYGNLSAMEMWEKIFQTMQSSENSYMVGKYLDKLDMFKLDPGALDSIMKTVQYCDQAVAKSAFQMFMNLGTGGESGNRALGETFEGLYYQGENGKVANICGAVSNQVIRRLVDMNFGPQEFYPKMKAEIEQDMAEMLKTLGELKAKGLIEGNKDLENYVLSKWALPLTNPENKLKPAPAAGPGPATVLSDRADGCRAEHKHAHKVLKDVNLADVNAIKIDLKVLKDQLAQDLRTVVEPEMIRAARELSKGQKIYNVSFAWGNKVADLFRKYYQKLLTVGTGHVRKEVVKQDITLSDRIYMAAKKPAKGQPELFGNPIKPIPTPAPKPPVDYFTNSMANYDAFYNEEANILADALGNNARTGLGRYYSAAREQGLTGDEMDQFITDAILAEAGQRYSAAAGELTGAYGQVREITAEQLRDVVKAKIRTGVLDDRICPVCEDQDGTVYSYDKDADLYLDDAGNEAPELPDANCEGNTGTGRNNCRCVYIYDISGNDAGDDTSDEF